jgi:hypothetical protein
LLLDKSRPFSIQGSTLRFLYYVILIRIWPWKVYFNEWTATFFCDVYHISIDILYCLQLIVK